MQLALQIMHQNLTVILQQFCYGKISFAVLFPGAEDDGQQDGVEKRAEYDNWEVEAQQQVVRILRHFRMPLDQADGLKV